MSRCNIVLPKPKKTSKNAVLFHRPDWWFHIVKFRVEEIVGFVSLEEIIFHDMKLRIYAIDLKGKNFSPMSYIRDVSRCQKRGIIYPIRTLFSFR